MKKTVLLPNRVKTDTINHTIFKQTTFQRYLHYRTNSENMNYMEISAQTPVAFFKKNKRRLNTFRKNVRWRSEVNQGLVEAASPLLRSLNAYGSLLNLSAQNQRFES